MKALALAMRLEVGFQRVKDLTTRQFYIDDLLNGFHRFILSKGYETQ